MSHPTTDRLCALCGEAFEATGRERRMHASLALCVSCRPPAPTGPRFPVPAEPLGVIAERVIPMRLIRWVKLARRDQ